MNSVEQAAVLLLGIGETNAAEILKHLEPKQVQKVGMAMTNMANVTKIEIEAVINEFLSEAEKQTSLGVNSEEYIRNVLTSALGEHRAEAIIDRILSGSNHNGLDALKWLDAKTVADLLRNEHPQIIATILTYLDAEQAAEIIGLFNEGKRVDLLMRMCEIDSVKPEALTELGKVIEEQLEGHKGGKTATLGGVKSVADVINHLDSAIEAQAMDAIKKLDNDLCDKIKEKMFVFENLINVDGRSMQTLLRDVSSDTLLLAMKGADNTIKEKIFANMSKRAAELLRDDLEAKGPVKVSDVDVAQKEILAIALKLADAGEITLGGKSGEEMI
jgi:flagellar motor switch protein FliG